MAQDNGPMIGCMQVGLLDHSRTVLCLRSASSVSISLQDFIIISRFTDEIAQFLDDFCGSDYLEDSKIFYVGKLCDFGDMDYISSFMKILGCSSPEQYIVGYIFKDRISDLVGVKSKNIIYNISPIALTTIDSKLVTPLEYLDIKICNEARKYIQEIVNKIY